VITPVKAVAVPFTVDGTSTVLEVDLATLGLVLPGARVAGLQTPAIAVSSGSVPATPAITFNGNVMIVTFGAAPPQFDNTETLITYTLSGLLQMASILPA
jgi:hypothetical protein